jgi:hypothetical protein
MLLHEAIKGIWALLKSGAIKDEEMAQLIAKTHLHLKMSHKTLDMVLLCNVQRFHTV